MIGQEWLNHSPGAIAPWHHQFVVVNFFQKSESIKVVDHFLAGNKPVKATIGLRDLIIQAGVARHDIDHRQVMTLADFVIIEIVGGSDLDAARTKIRVNVIIADDRNVAFGQW